MKININAIQHINAAIILGICIFYPLSYFSRYYAELGVVIWAFALPFIYFPDLIHISGVSKEEMRGIKKVSILGGWFWVLFWIGDLVDNKLIRIVSGALLVFLIIYAIYYIKKYKIKTKNRLI